MTLALLILAALLALLLWSIPPKGKVRFGPMPGLLHWYFTRVRKNERTWVTTPWGIYIARCDWPAFTRGMFLEIYDHELVHWQRMKSRPRLSQLWWCLHYLLSSRMAYEEEILAMRVELQHYRPGAEQSQKARWLAWSLVTHYGFDIPEDQILRDLLRDLA